MATNAIATDCCRKEVIMTTNTKAPRITKAMRFEDIAAMLKDQPTIHGSSVQDALDFIAHEMDLLATKNATKSGKQTATQKANAEFRSMILDFLATQADGVTCTQIAKGVPALSEFNNQKISALMRGLVQDDERNPDGPVTKSVVKGKSLFSLR